MADGSGSVDCRSLRARAAAAPGIGRARLRPGGEPRGRRALVDADLIEPAAARIADRTVEPRHMGLDVDDGRTVDDVNACEGHARARDLDDLDEAQSDRVNPLGAPG